MYCYNNTILKKKWKELLFLKGICEEMRKQGHKFTREQELNVLKNIKAEIRDTYKCRERYSNPNEYPQWRTPYGRPEDWDSRMCKYEEPYLMTPMEIKEYIDDQWQHWYNPYEDGRDCTGVWFTSAISCFPIPSRGVTIVYHWQNCDV